jgi:hypothetical protein
MSFVVAAAAAVSLISYALLVFMLVIANTNLVSKNLQFIPPS